MAYGERLKSTCIVWQMTQKGLGDASYFGMLECKQELDGSYLKRNMLKIRLAL